MLVRAPGEQGHQASVAGDAGAVEIYLSVIRLIEATPALLAANFRFLHDHEDELVGVLATSDCRWSRLT